MKHGLHYPETIRITAILPGDLLGPCSASKKEDNSYHIGDILDNINDVQLPYVTMFGVRNAEGGVLGLNIETRITLFDKDMVYLNPREC
jgi:hypothetical protein